MPEIRFLMFVATVVLSLGLIGPFGTWMVTSMAHAAIEAQQHDQISYGKFSRMLWSTGSRHRHVRQGSRN